MEELGIPELTSEQIEKLCLTAEKTAREYVLSKVPPKRVEELNVNVETEGAKPVRLNVEVNVSLSPLMKSFDVQKLVDEAVKEAFVSAEKFLRELKCLSSR
ncbi:DUF3194 domain-containing protein [Candidatus Bathyarchaeota archaeon]|nr:DUF3194 domain-containing protein [Candidatus Bathyarchaeota archaeon]